MKHYISFLTFIIVTFLWSASFSQSVVLNYAKGSSHALFDLSAKSSLHNVYGISFKKNKHTFGLNYSNSNFEYDEKITSADQRLLNFSTDLNTFGVAYNYMLGSLEKVNFDVGFTVGFSEFSSSANLTNSFGQAYEEADFSQWESLGYFSDNNFETSFSSINPDDISDFPETFFSFGPTLRVSKEIVKNVSIYLNSVYRKNLTDLLDNTTVNNKRGVSANSNDDNQFDVFVGISFDLSSSKKMDNDSLMNYIDSITNDDTDGQQNTVKDEGPIVENSPSNAEVISREDYLLSFFDTEEEVVDESVDKPVDLDDNAKTADTFDSDFSSDSLSREEYILNYFDIPSEEDQTSNQNELADDNWEEENKNNQIVEEDTENAVIENEANQSYYLIVGVFSQLSNLNRMADSLQINRSSFFSKNNLYYLYIFKTELENEARQLRDSLEVESWIYSKNIN